MDWLTFWTLLAQLGLFSLSLTILSPLYAVFLLVVRSALPKKVSAKDTLILDSKDD